MSQPQYPAQDAGEAHGNDDPDQEPIKVAAEAGGVGFGLALLVDQVNTIQQAGRFPSRPPI